MPSRLRPVWFEPLYQSAEQRAISRVTMSRAKGGRLSLGCFFSPGYGPNLTDSYRQLGIYAARILR